MSVIAFEVDSFDPVSKILQTMYLKFFLDNNTIEILQGTKFFLAKVYYPDITLNDLYIGNTVSIYNRRYLIKKYANSATTDFMAKRESHYICILKSKSVSILGNLISLASEYDLKIANVKTSGNSFNLNNFSGSEGDLLIQFVAITQKDTKSFLIKVQSLSPSGGIQAESCTPESVENLLSCFSAIQVTEESTLCLIKPHVLQANGFTGKYSFKLDGKMVWDNKEQEKNRCGSLISSISNQGFTIKAAFSIHLSLEMAEQFFDVYKGVHPKYGNMIEQSASGPVLALMIVSKNENQFDDFDVVKKFRDFCGPMEPELARTLRPNSLRAIYGVDLIKNAVHCTDLSEDGIIECKHFFETLASIV